MAGERDFDSEVTQYSDIRDVGFEVFEDSGSGSELKKIPKGVLPFDVVQSEVSRGGNANTYLQLGISIPRQLGSTITVCPLVRITFSTLEDDGSEKITEIIVGNGTNLQPQVAIAELPVGEVDGEDLYFEWDSGNSLFFAQFAVECPDGSVSLLNKVRVKIEAFDDNDILSLLDATLSLMGGQDTIEALTVPIADPTKLISPDGTTQVEAVDGGLGIGDTLRMETTLPEFDATTADLDAYTIIPASIMENATLKITLVAHAESEDLTIDESSGECTIIYTGTSEASILGSIKISRKIISSTFPDDTGFYVALNDGQVSTTSNIHLEAAKVGSFGKCTPKMILEYDGPQAGKDLLLGIEWAIVEYANPDLIAPTNEYEAAIKSIVIGPSEIHYLLLRRGAFSNIEYISKTGILTSDTAVTLDTNNIYVELNAGYTPQGVIVNGWGGSQGNLDLVCNTAAVGQKALLAMYQDSVYQDADPFTMVIYYTEN